MSWRSRAMSRPSRWQIATSASIAANFGELVMAGVNLSALYICRDPDAVQVSSLGMSGDVTRFWFTGAGAGIGVGTPIDVSLSSEDMPSGGLIYYGELTPEGKTLALEDLSGACVIRVHGAALLGGIAATVIGFGCTGGMLMASRAIGILLGTQLETPGVGVMDYCGYLWRGEPPVKKQ